MRSLIVVALVAVLAALSRADEQNEAKILEDRWPQCSQVVKGRLGAFHPFADVERDWSPNCVNSTSFSVEGNSYWNVCLTYQPCSPGYPSKTGTPLVINADDGWGMRPIATFGVVEQVDGRLLSFHMPVKKGDKPNFQGNYLGNFMRSTDSGSVTATATVTTTCQQDAPDVIRMTRVNATVASGNTPLHFDIQVTSKYACPLFPYTGKSVPPGGVAALVIVILCFVFQFGICAWYHKTQAVDENPFTAAEEYTNVE